MSDAVTIRLLPLETTFAAERGSLLRASLAAHGVELPCGGARACGGCGVRAVNGSPAATAWDREIFSRAELADGWRLACRLRAETDLTLELGGLAAPILTDNSPIAGGNRQGLGIAVDVGSTTIAAQLIDRASGAILGIRAGLNPQLAQGADVMSRVRFALSSPDLTDAIRRFLGAMVGELAAGREIAEVVLVGNTVMHHLFAGLDVEPLSHAPFASPSLGEQRFCAADWVGRSPTPRQSAFCLAWAALSVRTSWPA